MKLSCLALVLAAASPAAAADLPQCPAPLAYADERAELQEAIRTARNESAGRLLSRELDALRRIAPDRRAQRLLDSGLGALAIGDLDAARGSLDALVAYCPDYATGWHARAALRIRERALDDALADLDRAIDIAPDLGPAFAARAVVLWRLGRYDAAQAALTRALAINPWLPERRLAAILPGAAV